MGTSSVRRTPHHRRSQRGGGGDGEENQEIMELVFDAADNIDRIMKIVLPLLPNGSAKTPIYIVGSEALFFAYQWHEGGFENAIRESGRRISKEYFIPSIVNWSWGKIAERIPDGPLSGIAKNAYTSTMTQLLDKGVDALVDVGRSEKS